jgi:two-component system, NtrC family, C4-dicarboxylate transport sensor histidine kinase DctB
MTLLGRCVLWSLILALFAAIVYLGSSWSEQTGIAKLRERGTHRLDLYTLSLDAELSRYDYLPTLLSLNPEVVVLLKNPQDLRLRESVNRYLQSVNAQAGSSAFYVMDLNGTAIASSNWDEEVSFVGMDLSYRPYFQDALRKGSGRFYGIGTTSGIPGYYFSHGIHDDGGLLGVAALKVSLNGLEQSWQAAPEIFLVLDENGVIFLSSVPEWKFKTFGALSPTAAGEIQVTRQYDRVNLKPLDVIEHESLGADARIISLRTSTPQDAPGNGPKYLAQSRSLAESDWRLTLLSDLEPVATARHYAAAGAALAFAFLLLLVLYLSQRQRAITESLAAKEALQRAHDELERKVSERTADLTAANINLQREIAERKRAEQVLRQTQDGLVQAGKLAVLGEMSAGITHELNQPLAAIHTLSDNAVVLLQRGRATEVETNLATISELVDRMAKITGQLKAFARKSPAQLIAVSVRRAISNASFLIERRLRIEDASFEQELPEEDVHALCDSNRLIQVLVNLFSNALDAMAGCPVRRLKVRVWQDLSRVFISVRDSGTGIPQSVLDHLFEPFFTTKEQGKGLGLGLAISAGIVRDFGGTLKAQNPPEGGAEFIIELQHAAVEFAHVFHIDTGSE